MVVTTEFVQDDNSIEESKEDYRSTHADQSRTLSGVRRYLSHSFQKCVNQLYRSELCLALGRCMSLRDFVGPDHRTAPHNDTVVWNLIFLVIFFASLCLAARFPAKEVRIAFVSISGLVFIALSASVSIDLANLGRSKRRQPCLKIKAHYATRQSQVQKKSR